MGVSNSELKSWLSYWKKTLTNIDRKKIEVTTNPISVEKYFIGRVPQKHATFLWKTSKTHKDTKHIIVDICPCSIQSEYEHAKSKEFEEEVFYPFWIPAIMKKDGTLAPLESNTKIEKPFFVRDYLNPNPKDSYTISSIGEVDINLQKFDFNEKSWESYWGKCESFFSTITRKSFEEFNIKKEKQIFIQKGEIRGLTKNIRKLYKRLETTPPVGNLLNNLIAPDKIKFQPIPEKSKVVTNKSHIGQMNNSFPLSLSQRESMACYNLLEESNVLAVNGPPGTGKTTFLQSVVANSVVSTVINREKPELIIACSTNNQAITNILDSFLFESNDKLTHRWLPGLTSLGLYLSSKQNNKYQICNNEYGEGFLNDFENSDIKVKKDYFLKKYNAYVGESKKIEECKKKLLKIVQSKVSSIEKNIEIAKGFETIRPLLKEFGLSSTEELLEEISALQNKISSINTEIQQITKSEKELIKAKGKQPFIQTMFSFIPKYKSRRATSFQRALLGLNLKEVSDYSNFNILIDIINEKIISKNKLKEKIKNDLSSLIQLNDKTEKLKLNYLNCISDWDKEYGDKLKKVQNETGKEYRDLQPLEDMQVRMDLSYRYEAFWYSIHYREAEYLLNLETNQKKNIKPNERGKKAYKEKLQRFAGVTPIYISTFHSIPRYSTYYDYSDGEKAYFDLFDLIIVDEAGQVAPDIGIPSFSLAKKAIVVGDIFQIEPVWSVEEKLDIVKLENNNLILKNPTEEIINSHKNSGMLSSSGNLMKIAKQACFIREGDEGGTLLKEHRRCPDKIISYSNKYVYQNKLILTKGNNRKNNIDLPLKGFMHIDSASEKIGNSRRNLLDAITIAKWIESKRTELENSFEQKKGEKKKTITDILAIVTPYKSQALLIKNELLKIDESVYRKIISGTVHALQGAEIDIVIFSTVITPGNTTFYVENINMLNVAVSRAKSSFLVFGNLNAINTTKDTPLGRLKRWLQEDEDCELSNKIIFDNKETGNDSVTRINDLKTHVGVLNRAFEIAKSELIIVSPFISSNAIECDTIEYINKTNKIISIKKQILATVNKGVKVIIITDSTLDMNNNQLKPRAKEGREIIKQSGAILKLVDGIHSKTIIIDDNIIIDGSFNWFSALRNQKSKYFREESSIVVKGKHAMPIIKKARAFLEKVVK